MTYRPVRDMIKGVVAFASPPFTCNSSVNQAIQAWKYSMARQVGKQWPMMVHEPKSAETILLIIEALDDPVDWIEKESVCPITPCWSSNNH